MIKNYYLKLAQNEGRNNVLKVSFYYNLGGMNYMTYRTEPRGYYMSMVPMRLSHGDGYWSEEYGMFDGFKHLLKEVSRASKKAEGEALSAMLDGMDGFLTYAEKKLGLALESRELLTKEEVAA